MITAFVNSEWYQQHVRAGHTETIQHHMVVWSVDTLPQLFEVITFAHFQIFLIKSICPSFPCIHLYILNMFSSSQIGDRETELWIQHVA